MFENSSSFLFAFGTILDNRNFGNSPRVGFNGKEKDPETVSSNGNTYDYGFRIYNPSLGRFLSVDPLAGNYPWYTPYQFSGNKPVWAKDIDGLEEIFFQDVDKTKSDAIMSRLTSTQVGSQIINDFKNPDCNKGYNIIFIPKTNVPQTGRTTEAGLNTVIPPNDMIPNPVAGPNYVTPKELFDKLTEINDPDDDDSKAINNTLRAVYGDLMDNEDFVKSIKENKGIMVFAIDKDLVNVVDPSIPSTQKGASSAVGHEISAHGQNIAQGIKLDENLATNTDLEHENAKSTDNSLNEQLNQSIKKSEGGNNPKKDP